MAASSNARASARPASANRPRMPQAERRRQLAECAHRIIATQGVKALTMERLAFVAGISKPIVYAHFRDRQALVLALFDDYYLAFDALVGDAFEDHVPLEETVRAWASAYMELFLLRGTAVRQLLFEVMSDPRIEAARFKRAGAMIARVARKIRAAYRVTPAQARDAARLFRGALEAAGQEVLANPRRRRTVEALFCVLVASTLKTMAPRR
ncbi:MAG: TetR/AcrR family transcriptional regulator [Alphaproteobacteria bacterium]|nr:TetR/AcrR family transcriptional regulator [Alphaproteobacteria bacterium]